ncbi:hypothetical protein GCM10009111_28270 [Colwellia asteriadis]|uniref:Uncharacterized protein n=1 Tax=Colwellia asteriadis TaxID=517723 RepID=A0ABN1LA88_9GAMM
MRVNVSDGSDGSEEDWVIDYNTLEELEGKLVTTINVFSTERYHIFAP